MSVSRDPNLSIVIQDLQLSEQHHKDTIRQAHWNASNMKQAVLQWVKERRVLELPAPERDLLKRVLLRLYENYCCYVMEYTDDTKALIKMKHTIQEENVHERNGSRENSASRRLWGQNMVARMAKCTRLLNEYHNAFMILITTSSLDHPDVAKVLEYDDS